MDKRLRQIIKEEVYRVMQEIGQEDPVQLAGEIVKSQEEEVKQLEDELKFRQADARVSNLPKDEKDARIAAAKLTKDRLDAAKAQLEMSKKAQVSALELAQIQQNQALENPEAQSQTQSQI